MSTKRTLIIGDVQGCFDELQELLQKVNFQKVNDRLIFVGDLINRGPKSFEVLQKVRELNAQSVVGNHELIFLKQVKSGQFRSPQLEELANQMGSERDEWIRWIEELPTFIEEDDFLVVHAGLQPYTHPSHTDIRVLATIRTWDGKGKNLNGADDPPWFELYKGGKLVVFGHWAQRGLVQRPNAIGIDTGCVYGRKLSCLELPSREVTQVKSKRIYFSIE